MNLIKCIFLLISQMIKSKVIFDFIIKYLSIRIKLFITCYTTLSVYNYQTIKHKRKDNL